jgi:hypothetical protein
MRWRWLLATVLLASLAGCGKSPRCSLAPSCKVEGVAGAVPGVKISISADKCRFAVGEAATFRYDIDVDGSAPAISVPASSGCGHCTARTEDPLTFATVSVAGGTDSSMSYCDCDHGCCPPDVAQTVTLRTGRSSGNLQWPARTWSGPSDTNEQLGEKFRPGCYSVLVSFQGYQAGTVTAALPIVVE